MMNEKETLVTLSKNKDLKNDYNFAQILASEMHNYYIGNEVYIPENEIIKIIGKSKLETKIVLMPYQLIVLKDLDKSDKIVLSAPTSFGKTFIVMEYMFRNITKYNKIIYVVHTKSLKDEIYLKLTKYFKDYYLVTDEIDEAIDIKKYLLVLVSDGQNTYEYDIDVDLLIVDEAYNLSKGHSKDRHFCIMKTYHKLVNKAKKIILIGPFINEIKGESSEDYYLIKTEYSPVIQKIFEGEDLINSTPENKFIEEIKKNNKTIAYFGSKSKIYEYMDVLISENNKVIYTDSFIEWMEEFFPDFWLLPKLMKLGIGLYHSAFPKYLNIYNMNKFNKENFVALITTSAILEGINTTSKSLVLFDSTAGKNDTEDSNKLTSFQFFNLCGRVGRLGEEIVGYVYNFGDKYKDRYKERSLPLYIGNEELRDDYDELDNNQECENEVKEEIIKLLSLLNINYNDWYDKNSFYSLGSENMLLILKAYFEYRQKLKLDLENGSLNKVNSKEINRNKIIIHFYDHLITKVNKFKYTPRSKFYVQKIIPVFLRSTYKGIDFNMKQIFTDSEIKKNIEGMTIPDKNKYILEMMNVGYNYIPHAFNNISYLFNQFLLSDSFWIESDKKMLSALIYERVLLYLNGDSGENSKLKKTLSNMGVLPTIIEKIINKVKEDEIDVENITKFKVIKLLIDWKEELNYKEYEIINLTNIGINI